MAGRKRIAEALRSAREGQGLALERVAAATAIPIQYLRLLEGDEDLGATIPDELYLIPYFRRYASALGLDAIDLLPEFLGSLQQQRSEPRRPIALSYNSWLTRSRRPLVIGGTLVVVVILLLRMAPGRPPPPAVPAPESINAGAPAPPQTKAEDPGAIAALDGDATVAPDRPVVAASQTIAAALEAPARSEPEHEPGVVATGGLAAVAVRSAPPALVTPTVVHTVASDIPPGEGRELRVEAAEETWLSLGIDGEPRESYLLRPGETRAWRARKTFSLTVGNAGGISLALDGKRLPTLGEVGEVVRLQLPSSTASGG